MKNLRPIWLVLGFAMICITTPAAADSAKESAQPNAGEILAAYQRASGGLQALSSVESLHRSGTVSWHGELIGVLEGRLDLVLVPGKRIHTAVDLGTFSTTTAWDGTTGWEMGPQGFRTLEGEELERLRMQSHLLIGPELLSSPDSRIERGPDRDIDGEKHFAVTILRHRETLMTLYFDQRTHLLSQTVTPVHIPGVGEVVAVMDLWDYRPHQGVMLPNTVGVSVEGVYSSEVKFDRTTLNSPVDESLFTPRQQASR